MYDPKRAQPVDILLVEDNEADIELTRVGLERGKIRNHLHAVETGDEALDFLFQRGEFASAPRPGLILLDLNLPGRSGLEVLEVIKEDAQLKAIPVVVLTTSERQEDIKGSYLAHANSFVTKPLDFQKFVAMVQELSGYWFQLVRLPEIDA